MIKITGECEVKVTQMNFPSLTIYRPGLLICDRNELRPLEFVAQEVCKLLDRLSIKKCWVVSLFQDLEFLDGIIFAFQQMTWPK